MMVTPRRLSWTRASLSPPTASSPAASIYRKHLSDRMDSEGEHGVYAVLSSFLDTFCAGLTPQHTGKKPVT